MRKIGRRGGRQPDSLRFTVEDRAPEGASPAHGRNSPDERPWLRYLSSIPDDAVAIIEPLDMGASRGGLARSRHWRLRFDSRTKPFADFLMGWTGGEDPLVHLDMRFPTREAAMEYCERIGLHYVIHNPPGSRAAPVNKQRFELESPPLPEGWPDKPDG